MQPIILVAGATGNLGGRIIHALLEKGAEVRALVRPSTDSDKIKKLEQLGVKVWKVNTDKVEEVAKACEGATCVVSALAGLHEVIIDTQKVLLDAAVQAGVPRFIPSDFCLDFTHLRVGENRNLDMRRTFHQYLDKAPIVATTIFCGAFMDLLTDQMPMILFKQHRILYWGNADQPLDFTTMDNTAAFTANAALDADTPRFLTIAGDHITPRTMTKVVSEVTGHKFWLFRPGGLGLLNLIIKISRFLAPGKNDLYPAWQGMQYMRDMMEGRAKIAHYDNQRYPGIKWTTVKDMLAAQPIPR
jgi:nucleoside-diphosphate-sugar epimerase